MKPQPTSLVKFISTTLDLKRDSADFKFVFRQCLLCLTKGITAFNFQHAMKPYTKGSKEFPLAPSAKDFRLMLVRSSYMSLSLKLYALRLGKLRTKNVSVAMAKPIAQEYGIRVSDAKTVLELFNSDSTVRSCLKRIAAPIPADSTQWSELSLGEVFASMHPLLLRHSRYLARRKLRFAVQANNLSFDDIVNDLMEHIWSRFLQAVPTDKEPLHLLNSMRLAVTNEVNNLCDKFSTQKAARLVGVGKDKNNNSRSVLLVVSENQLPSFGTEGETSKYYDSLSAHDPFAKLDMGMSIERVFQSSSCQRDQRKATLLKILLGAVDEGFTGWLRANKFAHEDEENDELQERICPKVFNRLLAQYLKVPHDKVLGFLESVGSKIAPELATRRA